jgi:hypothetical protein
VNTCLSHIIVNFVNTANVANLARAVMTYAVRLSAIVSPRRLGTRLGRMIDRTDGILSQKGIEHDQSPLWGRRSATARHPRLRPARGPHPGRRGVAGSCRKLHCLAIWRRRRL